LTDLIPSLKGTRASGPALNRIGHGRKEAFWGASCWAGSADQETSPQASELNTASLRFRKVFAPLRQRGLLAEREGGAAADV